MMVDRFRVLHDRQVKSEPPTYASIQEDSAEEVSDASDNEAADKVKAFSPIRTADSQPTSHAKYPREDGFSRTFSAQSLPVRSITAIEDVCDMTLYDRALHMLACDLEYQKEVNLGKRIGFYKLGKELGAGNFSKVKLGFHVLTKEKVAVKIMDKSKMDQKAQRLLAREIQSLEKMNHPNIIRLFECVETLTRVHLVLEYASGGELYNYVHERGKLTEAEAKPLFAQIVSAVAHMHTRSIVHRDIKAENVMFSAPGVVKLVDFGFSCLLASSNQMLETFCGSPPYAAPELFRDSSYNGAMVDIWALGVLLYFMLVGVTPFRGETVAELKTFIMAGEFTIPDYLSTFATHLITSILEMNISKRLSIEEVKKNYWLRDAKFHRSYTSIGLDNKAGTIDDNELKEKAWQVMRGFGITKDMLENEHGEKGPRNAIGGTLRIVLYQIQSEAMMKDKVRKANSEVGSTVSDPSSSIRRRQPLGMKSRSKTCVII